MAVFNFYIREYEGSVRNFVSEFDNRWAIDTLYNTLGTEGPIYHHKSSDYRISQARIPGSMGIITGGELLINANSSYTSFHNGLYGIVGGWRDPCPNPNYDFESFKIFILQKIGEDILNGNANDPLRIFRSWNVHFLNRQFDGHRFFVVFYPGNDPYAYSQVDLDI